MDTLDSAFQQIVNTKSVDSDMKRENANINSDSSMGMMLKLGSEMSKYFTKKYLLRPEHTELHDEGYIHIHDLDFYPMTWNCCMINIQHLFHNGFFTGHGYIREPNSIATAANLMCICIQSNQNDMYGGQSIPTFEYDLAPYVVKSFKKHLARYLSHNGYSEYSIDIVNKEIDKIYKERGTVIDADGLDLLVHNVPFNLLNNQVMYAYEDTKKETYQAMEALVHNLNTMQSRCMEENQEVISKNGYIPIKDIKVGQYVLSYNLLTGKPEYKKVIDKVNQGLKEVTEFSLADGSTITCTPDHKVLTRENTYEPINSVDEVISLTVPIKIADKQQKGLKTVYDITVQDNHNFILKNGVVVKNCGAQTPFSSINYGTGTTAEQRLIIQMVLKATYEGLGNGETPIFPVQIFKLKKGINTEPTDPNYDLFEYSLKVTAKRLFPNYINLDASYNLPYYKAGHPETEVASMGCANGDSVIYVKDINGNEEAITLKEFVSLPNALDYRVFDSVNERYVAIRNVINNPETNDWYLVKFTNGKYLKITGNHYLPIEGKGRTITTNLEVGDAVKLSVWEPEREVDDLSIDKFSSWLLGMVIRDGALSTYNVNVYVGMDEPELADYIVETANHLGFEAKIREQHRGEKGNYLEINILKASSLVQKMKKYFRGTKKVERNIPKFIYSSPFAMDFMAGMIDADGTVRYETTTSIQLESTSEKLSLETYSLAQRLKLNPRIYINHKTNHSASYIVEFEATDTLVRDMKCKKKINKALSSSFAKFKYSPYVKITSIEKLNTKEKSYCLETETDTFDINGVCSHNCRTRVISNVNGPEITTGRGNIAFTTINLPRLAIEAKKDIKAFYASLEKMMYICFDNLQDRYNYIAKKHAYNYPFSVMQGGWINGDTLEPEEEIEPILKQGTLSVGFVGLAECLIALTGKHHGESEQSLQLGLDIMEFMRDLCDKQTELTHLNYSLFATPAESTAGTFLRADRKKFGIIKRVTDKDYYVNSFHVPPAYPISIFNKLKIEGRFHRYCNAG